MMKRIEGSLRSNGASSIAVDIQTRAKLKELAGDMPVSHYVRELAFREDNKRSGLPLPGQERLVSNSTLPAIASTLSELVSRFDILMAKEVDIRWINRPLKDVILEALSEYKARHSESSQGKQGNLIEGDMIPSSL
jgi:hypothetical protein